MSREVLSLSEREVLRRRGARVLVFDPADRVLLVRAVDPSAPDAPFWFTVGGGVEAGETDRAAAARELREETALVVAEEDLVGPVFAAADAFEFDRWWIEQSNVFFAVRIAVPAPLTEVDAVPGEVALLQTRAWWTLGQLRAQLRGLPADGPGGQGEPVYPPNLPDVVETALAVLAGKDFPQAKA
jgi:8-oxo-dGTP pyrophosphatase MutT (NUDIX family)